jgi:thiamine transporter
MKNKVKTLTYTSICIAMATLLSYVPIFNMPQGGSVTLLSMFFITLIGYWFGVSVGVLGGIVFGIIQLITNPFIITPIQVLLDYPMAFGSLGMAGLFKGKKNGLNKGYLLGSLLRLTFSTISGAIFFGEFTSLNQNILPSFIYNASYIFTEIIITLIIINTPSFKRAITAIGTP